LLTDAAFLSPLPHSPFAVSRIVVLDFTSRPPAPPGRSRLLLDDDDDNDDDYEAMLADLGYPLRL